MTPVYVARGVVVPAPRAAEEAAPDPAARVAALARAVASVRDRRAAHALAPRVGEVAADVRASAVDGPRLTAWCLLATAAVHLRQADMQVGLDVSLRLAGELLDRAVTVLGGAR